MAQIVIINDSTIAHLKQIRECAERNPLTVDDLLDMKNKQFVFPNEQVAIVTLDLRVMFAIVWQPKGRVRHMSVSLAHQPGRLPHPEAVKMIMPHLGFQNDLDGCAFVYKSAFAPGHEAIDIVEYLDQEENERIHAANKKQQTKN